MLLEKLSKLIASYLNKPLLGFVPASVTPIPLLEQCLRPGDLLLIEGGERISAAIKYLTQSTWSHATLCVAGRTDDRPCTLVEADLQQGVVAVPLQKYANHHTRICRPVGLAPEAVDAVVAFVTQRVGLSYDLKNVLDLVRYLFPLPVPTRYRRQALALGSGDPTRVICSTLIAQAFQEIRYPILPHHNDSISPEGSSEDGQAQDLLSARHHSLFTPRDFDVSPYFAIIKPTIEQGFEYRKLLWNNQAQVAVGFAGKTSASAVSTPSQSR